MVALKVAFVLRLMDDFSGKIILQKKVLFRRDGHILKPICKGEGLYVFLEPVGESVSIQIEGAEYHTCVVEVEKAKLDKKNPVFDVRLYGRRGEGKSLLCDFLEGRLQSGKENFPARVCVPKNTGTGLFYKGIKNVEGKHHLMVSGFTREQLQGKTFCLNGDDGMEVFVLGERIGLNEYEIDRKLEKQYPEKTPVRRVYCSVTDEKGCYAIPVDRGKMEDLGNVMSL